MKCPNAGSYVLVYFFCPSGHEIRLEQLAQARLTWGKKPK